MVRPTVVYLGPAGTYTHQAAYDRFQNDAVYEEKSSISDVFASLALHNIAVVPQENSTYGSVVETYDCLRLKEPYFVRGEITLAIQHCLLACKGTTLEDIDCIMSHEQALGQCIGFISQQFPNAAVKKMPSTAAAAAALALQPSTSAAICSRICATLFDGVEILREGIQDKQTNFTRFLVVSRDADVCIPPPPSPVEGHQTAMLRIFTHSTSSRGLNISDVLGALGLSIRRIDRRPSLTDEPFQDIYFVETGECNVEQDPVEWRERLTSSVDRARSLGATVDLVGLWSA